MSYMTICPGKNINRTKFIECSPAGMHCRNVDFHFCIEKLIHIASLILHKPFNLLAMKLINYLFLPWGLSRI